MLEYLNKGGNRNERTKTKKKENEMKKEGKNNKFKWPGLGRHLIKYARGFETIRFDSIRLDSTVIDDLYSCTIPVKIN